MNQVKLAVQQRLPLENELKRLLSLLLKAELRHDAKLTKRVAKVRRKLLLLKESIKPGSLRRAMKQDSRARMRGSQFLKSELSEEV